MVNPRDILNPLSIPSPYAGELVEKLTSYSVIKRYPAGRKLPISSGNAHFCYLITHGKIELCLSSHMVLGFGTAPLILGLGSLTGMYRGQYIKTLTPCDIGTLSAEDALDIIGKEDLWKLLAEHLLVISAKLYTVCAQYSQPSAYEMIRAQLYQLHSEDESIRTTLTAENYIRSKTNLSRSGIMKILHDLKSGGYIELDRGRLVTLRELPKKY